MRRRAHATQCHASVGRVAAVYPASFAVETNAAGREPRIKPIIAK